MKRRPIRLRGVSALIQGKSWESEDLLQIGRLDDLEIVLDVPSISRRHAEVALTDQGWVVRDLGSTNGTFLNGTRIGRADQKLSQGDVLVCGDLKFAVEIRENNGPPDEDPREPRARLANASPASGEHALALVAGDPSQLVCDSERLVTLLRIGRDFSHDTSLDDLLGSILYDALHALRAQRGCIALVEAGTGQPIPRVCRPDDPGLKDPQGSVHAVVQRTLDRGESLLGRDVRPDAPGGPTPRRSPVAASSSLGAFLRTPNQRLGVLYLERGPFAEPFHLGDLHLADALAASVAGSIASVAHFLEREQQLFVQTLTALAQAVDLRDDHTGSHTQRVTDYALLLADELQVPAADRQLLQIGTPLHDIGKIGISDAILRKPGPLTEEEFTCMQSHTVKGAAILEIIPRLTPLIPIVRHHHERWDGGGYPDHLRGRDISCLGRIVAVADAFDAMTSDRPYRRALPLEQAFDEIHKRAGTQFDPECAAAFVRLRPRLEETIRRERSLLDTLSAKEMSNQVGPASPAMARAARTGLLPRLTPALLQAGTEYR